MAPFNAKEVDIVDIRRDKNDESLLHFMLEGLNPENSDPRSLPTLLLYDERGLKLFEQITYLEEYYLTNAEIEALHFNAGRIVDHIPEGARLVELGSGNLRKIEILFKAFEKAQKNVEYFALDLSRAELMRTFSELSINSYDYVTFHALHGTYDDGLAWLSQPANKDRTICVLTLGSSLGNFSRAEAATFLASFANVLNPSGIILVGLDACQDPQRVYRAYNDSKGLTEQFYRNGLDHANRLFGYQAFRQEDWAVRGTYNEVENRHEAHYEALRTVDLGRNSILKGEKVQLEAAFKYSQQQSDELWHASGLTQQMSYSNHDGMYNLHLLSPSRVMFSTTPRRYAPLPVPSIEDWQQLWTAWDTVTKSMVPRDELMNKPIRLRNNLIFYLGHIPTFADIHVTKAIGAKPTDPASYVSIFERGIDPDVDNPELCHSHSEIPDTWPPLEEVLDYQLRVRERITTLIGSGAAFSDKKLGRGLWLAFEHEAMHLETFLYMLLQSERVLAPPGVSKPDFKVLAAAAEQDRVPYKWHRVPETEVTIGLDDLEGESGPERYFGWDNERPSRKVKVGTLEAASRPISNGEYARFLEATHNDAMPVSWTVEKAEEATSNGAIGTYMNGTTNRYSNSHMNGHASSRVDGNIHDDPGRVATKAYLKGKAVRTVFGLVPLAYAVDWPVMASYDELAAFAKWSNGRIPTFEEARSIYSYVEGKKAEAVKVPSNLISAVNGHLCNDGVQESPPSNGWSKPAEANTVTRRMNGDLQSELDPSALFIDLTGSNIGFANWHPTPITHISTLSGQSSTGGLWEWTSTSLASFPGFKSMDLYPGYTADFFDGKHNICLGGSWATIPRIAGRKSFVNWYQRNYPYVWCTARLVRDVQE